MADLSTVWKAKAKSQKRELERLRLTIQKQSVVLQRAKWMSVIIRQARQKHDSHRAGDTSPLDMNVAERDALLDFEKMYHRMVDPATWFPLSEHFWKITTA